MCCVFFFKQKTAYEVRISDWSSDVCSSDLRRDTPISDIGQAKPGDLVLAEPAGRLPRISARVTDVLGDPFAPRSFSLIAIHKYGIPFAFPEEVEEEAARVAALPLHPDKRQDLRHLPSVAFDPVRSEENTS